jgi:tRNA threonylcarbamoyladenosine biosynthesis protein TsaB
MKLLAVDTSLLACTAAAMAGERTCVRYEEREREHTKRLVPMVREVLGEAGLRPVDLDAVVLGNGPGSFIGMRIAASVACGLAYGAGLDVVPVSSLAAVACRAGRPGELVAVAQDAHMGEVYLGLYRLSAEGVPVGLTPERLQPQQRIPELDGCAVAAGAGWQRYPALLEANRAGIARQSDVLYPHAGALLALGAQALAAGAAIAPENVVPAYLRQEVARIPPGPTP